MKLKHITKNFVIKNNWCISLDNLPVVQKSLSVLRRGYPAKPYNQQCRGPEFRKHSKIIINQLVKNTLSGIKNKKQIVIVVPWRAGLVFAETYRKIGINKFYHLSSRRDEKTFQTIVNFESGNKLNQEKVVIIADPMLATGNTLLDAIKRVIKKNVREKNIIINSIIGAPIGVAKIKKKYPQVKIILGCLDEKLDNRGYIVPGLGDFGDKYFDGLNVNKYTKKLKKLGIINKKIEKRLTQRLNFHLSEAGVA